MHHHKQTMTQNSQALQMQNNANANGTPVLQHIIGYGEATEVWNKKKKKQAGVKC